MFTFEYMRNRIRFAGIVFGSVLMLYLVAVAGFFVFQERFIFQGEPLPSDHRFSFRQKFEEHTIPTGDGESINALFFKADSVSKGLVLYFHGNAGNLQRWGNYASDFTSLGYDILIIDYRGYGKSTGTPSEENLYRDAGTVLTWAKKNIQLTKLVFLGRSLGSAVATDLAAQTSPDLLILETPFDELSSVLYFMPSRFKFPNNLNLPKVTCRKVIIHGTDDGVVPLSSALNLKPLLGERDRFVIIEGGSHNDLNQFEEYHQTLGEVLN